ncbi:MAG: ABC transporter permease, partial [Pseudomonadota bacterium]|nr:ABC transporter permease [Pseudomonadota bacterium]
MMRYFLPAFIGILTLGIWEIWVALANIPSFVLPAPTAIFDALLENANTLFGALTVTLYITTLAFFWAVISGIALAVIFTRARIIEMA